MISIIQEIGKQDIESNKPEIMFGICKQKIYAKEGSITGSKSGPNGGDNNRGRNCVCEFAITHTTGGMANICQTKDDGDYYQMNVSSLFGLSVFDSRYISSDIICVIISETQF